MKKIAALLTVLLSASLLAQTTDSVAVAPYHVDFDARVEPSSVPLNRPLTLVLTVRWNGPMSGVMLGSIKAPELTNFTVAGSGSSHRLEAGTAGQISVKEVRYTLMPQTLGMAYIEPAVLSYTLAASGEAHQVTSPRFSVEIKKPVREAGKNALPWPWLAGAGLLLAGAGVYWWRKRQSSADENTEIETPVEEEILTALKSEVDLSGDGREAYARLARLFRRYLAERYSLPALETPTQGVVTLMKETDLQALQIEKFSRMLEYADKVKFSGLAPDRAELSSSYTAFETLLERRLASSLMDVPLKN